MRSWCAACRFAVRQSRSVCLASFQEFLAETQVEETAAAVETPPAETTGFHGEPKQPFESQVAEPPWRLSLGSRVKIEGRSYADHDGNLKLLRQSSHEKFLLGTR